jgi:hypothetical protein
MIFFSCNNNNRLEIRMELVNHAILSVTYVAFVKLNELRHVFVPSYKEA